MSPTPQPEEVGVLAEWGLKLGGIFMAFVSGIVAATWALKGYVDELKDVKEKQNRCQSEVIVGLADKLDSLPDRLDAKMEAKFARVHARIDELWKEKQ